MELFEARGHIFLVGAACHAELASKELGWCRLKAHVKPLVDGTLTTVKILIASGLQSIGRPYRGRLSTEVIHQLGHFCIELSRVRCIDGREEIESTACVKDSWTVRSMVLMGKQSPFVLGALLAGMPLNFSDKHKFALWRQALVASFNRVVLDQLGDK